jgi:hypothetical protein
MTGGVNAPLDTANSGLAVSCDSTTTYVDPSLLQIEGAAVAQKGQPVAFKLNKDLGCSPSQKVSWKTIASGQPIKSGSTIKSIFQKAGEYVIVAQVEGGQPTNSQLSLKSSSESSSTISFKTVVVSDQPVISGPVLAMVGADVSYSLAVPAGLTIESANWDFGDSSSIISSLNTVDHSFGRPGTYQISVNVVDSNQVRNTLTHQVTVLMIQDGLECVSDLAISGPSEVIVGTPAALSLFIPPCLTSKITAVKWDFGDDTTSGDQSVQHTYQTAGNYQTSVQIFVGSSTTPWVTLTHDIRASVPPLDPTPSPSPEPIPQDPTPTPIPSPSPSASPTPSPTPIPTPSPSPSPEPTPENPRACSLSGNKRTSQSELYSETVACGTDGTKNMSYRDLTVEECKLVSGSLEWTVTTKTKELQNEGSCQGQSCKLPDGSMIKNGGGKTYYSTETPAGSCSSVTQVRSCNNGILSGSADATHTVCHDGCGDFGSHGTTKNNIITGQVNVPMTCAFGEQGIFSIFNQISDQVCKDGQIVTSNTRQGGVKTPGSCPTYTSVPTDSWTTCSADCGGKQSRISICKDDKGTEAPAERCAKVAPLEERLCDGNPAAVRRQEQSVVREEANSSEECPSDQIGVVGKSRDITTTTTFACIGHQVQQEKKDVLKGSWVSEKYCRDYVSYNCSKDSLDDSESLGRYKWMVKCQDQIPAVKEFLGKFTDVGITIRNGKVKIDDDSNRILYPTFVNRATKPEKIWIAPKLESASCSVPATIYITAVCEADADCATPEQQILASPQSKGNSKYTTFIEALTRNYSYVSTLKTNSDINSNRIEKIAVDKWVTTPVDADHDIIVFKMKSGGSLKVTPNHPLLASDGLIKAARDFKVGDHLVVVGGKLDPIISLDHMNHYGKVYNLLVKSSDLKKNIVITNGYLNGTAFFQNKGAENMNRQIFKNKMIQGVFSK